MLVVPIGDDCICTTVSPYPPKECVVLSVCGVWDACLLRILQLRGAHMSACM